MVIRIQNKSENSFTKNVSFMFVVYWAILVIWQNIGIAETRSSFDTIIKIGLLAYFTGFYLLRARTINIKVLPIMLLAISLMITAFTESQLPLTSVVAYAYPIIVLLLVYGMGDKLEISRSHLVAFCNCIICIVAYTVFYSMLFFPEQYSQALGAEGAYGNELSSFFISNHEYGMYLVAATISVIICLRLRPNMRKFSKALYVVALTLFVFNLFLTFSRTSLLGLGVFLLSYSFCETPKARKWIVLSLVFAGLALVVFPSLTEYIYKIVLKENTAASRDVLFERGIQFYQDGTLFEKVFGRGIYEVQMYFRINVDHSNTHNGYLQVLLYYGLIGCGALILFMLSQIMNSIGFLKKSRFGGALSLALTLSAVAMMFTNTSLIFTSAIDSFFLTAFFVIMPKYVRNSISEGRFDGNAVENV